MVMNEVAQGTHSHLYPFLRIGTHRKGHLEHNIHKEEKYGIPPQAVRHNGINDVGGARSLLMVVNKRLAKCPGNKSILGIGNSLFRLLAQHLPYAFLLPIASGQNLFPVGQLRSHILQVFIILQQFDGQKAGRILMTYGLILTDGSLHRIDAALQFCPVVDMDMVEIALRLMVFGIGTKRMVGHILTVPIA